MRFANLFLLLTFTATTLGQNMGPASEIKSVTVPITLDHNRVVINADLTMPDGSTTRVKAWVDNGNPDLYLSRRVASLLGLAVSCSEQICSAPPPQEISIGGMKLSLAGVKSAKVPLKPARAEAVMAPGMSVEVNLPSSVLRNYDVLVNFPGRELTIASSGTLKFDGVKTKVIVNAENGLIQVPSQLEKKKYTLALDLGSSISLLSPDLFDKLCLAHPEWPHMTGAVGPANMWGLDAEYKSSLLRLDRIQYGPLFLTGVPVVRLSPESITSIEKHAGVPTVGLLGSEALLNYRIGIDYAHSTVYFDIGRLFKFPDFNVIGLILRPEDDGRFTVLGVAEYGGKPSVSDVQPGDLLIAVDDISTAGSTLGQVLAMLSGDVGQERMLTIESGGKEFHVTGKVQHFLGESAETSAENKSLRKK